MTAGARPRSPCVQEVSGVDEVAAALVVDYLHAGRVALGGVLPTHDDIVFERFFDECGGMQLIVHAPLGARVNRALGLGLRKKFCLNFDFELQAAASNDAVLLSLGPQHSFPLEDVPAFLRSHNVQDAVSQAVLRSPMFTARWRWNLNRSLAVLRRKGGRINPFNIQRMESDDLMAAVFPDLAACQDGTVLSWEGRYDEARQHLDGVLSESPTHSDALLASINVELWSDHPGRAEELARRGLRQRPTDAAYLLARVRALVALKRSKEARDTLERLLAIDPRNQEAVALRRTLAASLRLWQVRGGASYDAFSDQRDPWREWQGSIGRMTPRWLDARGRARGAVRLSGRSIRGRDVPASSGPAPTPTWPPPIRRMPFSIRQYRYAADLIRAWAPGSRDRRDSAGSVSEAA